MSAMTTYLKNKLVDHVLRGITYTPPETVYVALFTTATDDAGGGTEVASAGYVRQALTVNAPSDGLTDNSDVVSFGPAAVAWGTISHVAVYDDDSGGNMLLHGPITESKPMGTGDSLSFAVGALDFSFQ